MTDRRRHILWLTFFYLLAAMVLTRIHNPKLYFVGSDDDESYYAYGRALLIDHRLPDKSEPTETGGKNPGIYAVGAGVLWMPFLATGHAFAHLFQWDPPELHEKGIGDTDWIACALGSATLGFAGCLFLYLFLRHYFSARASLMSVLVVIFSSPLPHYLFRRPLMAHATSFFCLTAACYALSRLQREPGRRWLVISGLLVAGIYVCRWTEFMYVIGLGSLGFWIIWHQAKTTTERLQSMAGFALVMAIPFVIQMAVTHQLMGAFLPPTAQHGVPDRWLLWRVNPWTWNRLQQIFFGIDWGILRMSPILIFALAGAPWALRKRIPLPFVVGLLVPVLMVTWMISNYYGQGAEYGHRYLISIFVFFSVCYAAVTDQILQQSRRWLERAWVILSGVSLAFSLLLFIQFKTNATTLTLHLLPVSHLVPKDWMNYEYTQNATANIAEIIRKPMYGISLFTPSPAGYMAYRVLRALNLMPHSAKEAYNDYLVRHVGTTDNVPIGRHLFFLLLFTCPMAWGMLRLGGVEDDLKP